MPPSSTMIPFMEPIHILGGGSIGMFWASSIRTAFPSYPLAVLVRPQHKRRLLQRDATSIGKRPEVLVCTMQNRRPRMASVPVEFIGDDRMTPIRNLILATKSYRADAALEGIFPRLRMSASARDPLRIFILSNGALDVRENLQQLFSQHRDLPCTELIMCATTQGVIREKSDDDEDEEPMIHLSHVAPGSTFLGGVPAMTQLWDQSGLNAKTIDYDDECIGSVNAMEVLLWKKLTENCFCSPLTALWGVTIGELMNRDEAPRIRKQLVQEISTVARALHPSWPAVDLSVAALDSFVEQGIQNNLNNRSSMYYDLKHGQRTEVESLNGYIVRKGREMGIETPNNLELLNRIQDLDATNSVKPYH